MRIRTETQDVGGCWEARRDADGNIEGIGTAEDGTGCVVMDAADINDLLWALTQDRETTCVLSHAEALVRLGARLSLAGLRLHREARGTEVIQRGQMQDLCDSLGCALGRLGEVVQALRPATTVPIATAPLTAEASFSLCSRYLAATETTDPCARIANAEGQALTARLRRMGYHPSDDNSDCAVV